MTNNAFRIDMGAFKTDPNRSFWGRTWRLISRFTWEYGQNELGQQYSHSRNISCAVDNVSYLGGATFVVGENSSKRNGVSLGSFLNINIDNEIVGGFRNFVTRTPLFMHEYGHIKDSRMFGPIYLFAIGVPSILGTDWTERRANRHAANYYGRHFQVDWTDFDLDWPRRRRR